jgi:hypothetical protein
MKKTKDDLALFVQKTPTPKLGSSRTFVGTDRRSMPNVTGPSTAYWSLTNEENKGPIGSILPKFAGSKTRIPAPPTSAAR